MSSGIYCIENKINGKKYVGRSVNISRRWIEHRYRLRQELYRTSSKLHRAWKKYGEESFEMYILETCSEKELSSREIFYIELYDSYHNGYNMTCGGDGGMSGCPHSEESKEIMRQKRLGKKSSKETKRRISESKKKSNYKWSSETREKMNKYMDVGLRFGKKLKNASSGFYGVYLSKSGKYQYWLAKIKVRKVYINIGNFKFEEDAARAYDILVIENNLPNPLNFQKR